MFICLIILYSIVIKNTLIIINKMPQFTKETMITTTNILENEGIDGRNKNTTLVNLDKEVWFITKNFEKKRVLDFLENKDNSIMTKVEYIEKYSYLLDKETKYTGYLISQKDLDDF